MEQTIAARIKLFCVQHLGHISNHVQIWQSPLRAEHEIVEH
jgi:hypothetical protein